MITDKNQIRWYEMFLLNILKCGQIPKHVAYIMDGNRRFARQRNLETIKGHHEGFEKLKEIVNWSRVLDIKEITVYAFSIENFKRSKEEVDGLMDLCYKQFQDFFKRKNELIDEGIRIQFFGKLELFPLKYQKLMAEIVVFTKDCDRYFMNFCVAYTSREEMTTAIKEVKLGVERNLLQIDDIDEQLISKCLYTSHSYDLDLLVRTSGETRLSDFLLWQSSFSMLSFTKILWPDFNIWTFFAGIVNWQIQSKHLKEAVKSSIDDSNDQDCGKNKRRHIFLRQLYEKRFEKLLDLANE